MIKFYIITILFFIYCNFIVINGQQIFSSSYCLTKENTRLVNVSQSAVSPCSQNCITMSWNYSTIDNNDKSIEWYNCKVQNSNNENYYQVGGCSNGAIMQDKSTISFSSYVPYFYITNCMFIDGPTSYGYTTVKTPEDGSNMVNQFMDICRQTGADYFQYGSWYYSNNNLINKGNEYIKL